MALCLLLAGIARAQEYQRLHVRSFTLASDTANPQLEQPFHVTLTIRVPEKVSDVRNVFLPTFGGAEELGDERAVTQGPGGTAYRETLTLVAHARGTLSVSPAYLDAIDARDGKPKRFISNSLDLPVGGGPETMLRDTLRTIALVVIDVALAGAAVFVAAAIFWRRRRRAEPEAPLVPIPPKDDLEDAVEQLRQRRDRGCVLRLRAALWHLAGAGSGETLGDVLRRPAAADERLRRLLMIVERAAFIEQARLSEAIDEVLAQREWTFA